MSAQERDEFLAGALVALEGECRRELVDPGPWCRWHNAFWDRASKQCKHMNDLENFGDAILEMWEGRG